MRKFIPNCISGSVVYWLSRLLHTQKVLGSIPSGTCFLGILCFPQLIIFRIPNFRGIFANRDKHDFILILRKVNFNHDVHFQIVKGYS